MCVKCEGLEVGKNNETIKISNLEVSGKDRVEILLSILKPEKELGKYGCMHYNNDGLFTICKNEDGTLTCTECGTVINDIEIDFDKVSSSVAELINTANLVKIISNRTNMSDAKKEVLSNLIKLLDQLGFIEIVKEAVESFNKMEQEMSISNNLMSYQPPYGYNQTPFGVPPYLDPNIGFKTQK